MRILNFNGARDEYEVLYMGLLATSRGFEAPIETRLHSRLLDKFEAIGVPTDDAFTLMPDGGRVTLEEVEYQLMEDCLKQVKWKASGTRRANKAMDFFYEADSDTPK
jgi:hypothetical protein